MERPLVPTQRAIGPLPGLGEVVPGTAESLSSKRPGPKRCGDAGRAEGTTSLGIVPHWIRARLTVEGERSGHRYPGPRWTKTDSNQHLLRPVPHQRLPRALGGADAPHTWTPGGSPLPVSLDSGVTRSAWTAGLATAHSGPCPALAEVAFGHGGILRGDVVKHF
jgi:hypothetical protein